VNRWAVVGVAVALIMAAAALAVPSLMAASGKETDPAAFGATSPPVVWESPSAPDQASASAADGGGDGELVVHVAGAVANPGVFLFKDGARVIDAVDRAGGASADADLAALNLAARLSDGERIYVPRPGETPPPVINSGGGDSGGSAGGGASTGGKINVNQASAAELTALPGVGPVLAQRIVDFRETNGPFGKLNDLAEVSGIGPKVLAGLADSVDF
jgi:competence protein ComEA